MWTAKLLHVRHLIARSEFHIAMTVMLCSFIEIDDTNVSVPLEDVAFGKVTVVHAAPVKFCELVEDSHPVNNESDKPAAHDVCVDLLEAER